MKTARDLMTAPAECLAPDETIVTAARMLSKYDVGSMPLLDGGEVIGVIAQADVARELDEGTTGEVVEEISQ